MAPAPKEVGITGVDISFLSAVGLMVKWSLASIPATIIVSLIFAIFFAMGGGVIAAIAGAIGYGAGAAGAG